MGKAKNNTKAPVKENAKVEIAIDYDKLADAIVKAEAKAIEDKKKKELEDREAHRNKVLTKYGYKEGNKLSKIWASLMLMLRAKREDIEGDETTFSFLQLSVEYVLLIGEYFLYMFCAAGVYAFINPSVLSVDSTVFSRIVLVVICVPVFFGAKAIKVARFEIDKMKDRDYMNAVVGSFMAIIATIVALISLFRGQ